jgi:hypothetical protein
MSLLSNTHKILSNSRFSRLTLYEEEILGDHRCGFRCNTMSNANHLFCIRQILEGKKEYNETEHQLQESL